MSAHRRIALISEMVRHVPDRLQPLSELGFELVALDGPGELDERRLIAALEGCWGSIAGSETYNRNVLESAPDLRVIARTGVGFDAIDMDAATELGVAVVTTPGANADAVADFALALMLTCLRRVKQADADVRSGRWRPGPPGRDLYAATVGIVGFGKIGQAVARRLRGFACRVLVVEPFPERDACTALGVELSTLEEMLPQVDVLTLHTPLGAGTHHLIGDAELRVMRPHAVLVNTSRGSVVDGRALAAALREGVIAGAGIDVFEQEPLPAQDELMKLPNVVLSGHIAGFTDGAMAAVVSANVKSLIELSQGRTPRGCVNPEALKRASMSK